LTDLVHKHDAHMAEMLELKRQFLVELVNLPLRAQIFDGRFDETLRHFERGFDLDPGCGARIQNRHGAGDDHGKKINRSDGYDKLRSDGPVIPKFLQHEFQVSKAPKPRTTACGLGATPMQAEFLFP
jgi:hypothetical protein